MALSEHLDKLRYFHQLAQFNSIREASASIGLSETGLAKSLNVLEDALETRLFLRTKTGLKITKEGAEVLEMSKRILSDAKSLEIRLRGLKQSSSPQKLRLGVYDSIAVYFFGELSHYLSALYPKMKLELTVDSSSSLYQKMKSGELDIAIGVSFSKAATSRTHYYPLFEDTYSFYVAPGLEDAEDLPLLIHPLASDEKGKVAENWLRRSMANRARHSVFNFETLKVLTAKGLGIGLLPTQVAKPLVQSGQLLNVELPGHRKNFGTHAIGFLAQATLADRHGDFVNDLYRLGERWKS